MKKFGSGVITKPLITILVILIITGGFAGALAIKGMVSRMDEKDFTPNLEEAKADRDVSQNYTATYHLSIFVRSEDKKSNVITVDNMVEILELEKKLYNDDKVRGELRKGKYEDIISVADIIAQTEIMKKVFETVTKITKEFMSEMNEVVNSTVQEYLMKGISSDDSAQIMNKTLNYTCSRLPAIEQNTTLLAQAIYAQTIIFESLNESINGVVREFFAEMNNTFLATNFSEMNDSQARQFINSTVDATIGALIQNATMKASYVLSMEIEPIIYAAIYTEIENVSMVFGAGLGIAFADYMNENMSNMMYTLSTRIKALMDRYGFSYNYTGISSASLSEGIPEELGHYVNDSIMHAVENFSIAMSNIVMEDVNESVGAMVAAFSASLGENLSMRLIPLGYGIKESVFTYRMDKSAINATVNNYEILAEENATEALNESMAIVDLYFSNFTHGNLCTECRDAGTASWYSGILPNLNSARATILSSTIPQSLSAFELAMPTGNYTPTEMMELFSNISYDDKIVVFSGGNITNMSFAGFTINLHFSPMSDDELYSIIRNVYTNATFELKFLAELMNNSFTKEFSPPDKIYAVGMMISLSLSPELSNNRERAENAESYINSVVEDYEKNSGRLVYTTLGVYLISDEIMDASMESMNIILTLAFIFVIIILAIIYRNVFDLFMSLIALGMAVVWVYGFGSLMGYVFNPLLIAVPVLIIGLGIDFGIHITMRYREEIMEGLDVRGAMVKTIGSVGFALLLATFTTIVAFLSNALSPIPALSQFGILCAFGIFASFVIMVTLIPAAKVLRDERRERAGKPIVKGGDSTEGGEGLAAIRGVGVRVLNKWMSLGAVGSEHHPYAVLAIAVIITVAGFYSLTQIPTRFDIRDFLPEEVPIARELSFMLDEYGIENVFGNEVVVLVRGNIATVEFLNAAERSIANMSDDKYVLTEGGKAKVTSILSLMYDYANYTPGGNDYRYDPVFATMYEKCFDDSGNLLPNATDDDVKALMDWLYENATLDATSVIHKGKEGYDGALLRVEVNVPDDRKKIYELRSLLSDDIKPITDSSVVSSAIITSGPILKQLIHDALNQSQINSIIITLIMCLIALGIVYLALERSFILGVLTTLPMVFCMAWLFGTMYLLDIPRNVLTITIASLTVGLGITYGIHVSHRFAEELAEGKEVDEAMYTTVMRVGTAIFGAAITTIAGFGLQVFALLPPIKQFGGMTALAILYSFLSSVFVLPSLLVLWAKHRRKEGKGDGEKGSDKSSDTENIE